MCVGVFCVFVRKSETDMRQEIKQYFCYFSAKKEKNRAEEIKPSKTMIFI